MSSFCCICREVKEQVLVFPCSDQHKACHQCLQNLIIEPGTAVKCPECRTSFGKVNFNLWKVEGGIVPVDQICSNCLDMDERDGLALHFCIECDAGRGLRFCESHFEYHEQTHIGRRAHRTIPFDEYRVNSDKFTMWACERHALKAEKACRKCGRAGCDRCFDKPTGCPKGGKHSFDYLDARFQQVSTAVNRQRDMTKATNIYVDDKLKGLLESMEEYRVEIASRKSTLQAQSDAKVDKIEEERRQLDAELESCLQKKTTQVESERHRLRETISSLQKLEDGLGEVLDSYHPARLVQDQERIELHVEEKTTLQEVEIDFTAPQLEPTAVNESNLLSLVLNQESKIRHQEPTAGSHQNQEFAANVYQDAESPDVQEIAADINFNEKLIAEPSFLKFTRQGTTLPPAGLDTFSVSHSPIDGILADGGNCYARPTDLGAGCVGVEKYSLSIECIRFDDEGNPVMLKKNSAWKESSIVTFERKTLPDGCISYTESQSIVAHYCEYRTHFIQDDDETFYQTGYRSNKIFICKKSQGVKTLEAREMARPWGICRHNDQMFIACCQAIMTFSLTDPSKKLKKFATADTQLSGIAYHRGHLYATKWSDWTLPLFRLPKPRIYVFNMQGRTVKTFEIPETLNHVCDISIDEDGRVAVASWNRGVVSYQLSYKE